jgi:DNA-binding NtrC family response regulator
VFEGAFREDLFFRIVVIRIAIPPLRERREDIPLLVAHFLRGLSHGRHQGIPDLTERAMTALMNYSWPGNVRQVKNSIEQALVLADGKQIDLEHFPSLTRAMSETPGASEGGMPPPDVGQVDPLSGPPYPRPITRPSDAMLRAKAKEIAGFVRARGLSVEDALEVYNRVLDGLRQARGHPPASGTGSEGRAA